MCTYATQLRIHRLFNHLTATYESASTRQFYKGRTDTIRSSTNAALTFVKTMVNPASTVRKITRMRYYSLMWA